MTKKIKHPLAEVFGFPIDNISEKANRFRTKRLCPFNNKVPSCTKDKANDPLGVCSIYENGGSNIAITCPIRFREDWKIVDDAASFFFPDKVNWTSLSEVRLNNKDGNSAGNIDMVLVSYDANGKLIDFGALEIQGVYISGNIRLPFTAYMSNPDKNKNMDWTNEPNFPRPDYLSSSRKRLVPQLIYKGGILRTWKKKSAVVIHKDFYSTLPVLTHVDKKQAEIAWLIYDLAYDSKTNVFKLVTHEIIYTLFEPALDIITKPNPGSIDEFSKLLQNKLDEKLDGAPPDAPILGQILGE
jgi:hypothetical protein